MSTWPLPTALTGYSFQRGASIGGIGAVNVPTGGTAHTKGAWTQVRASSGTDSATSLIRLYMGGHTSTGVASPALVDIGIGGSGSETVILENLDVGFHATPLLLAIPFQIAPNTRLAARAQGARTAVNIATALDVEGGESLIGSGVPSVSRWTTYGADTANSCGTSVTPGGTNTFGSWVQLGSATASDHDYWFPMFDFGADTAVTSITYRVQLAVAANTTDASTMATNGVLAADWVQSANSAEYTQPQQINGIAGVSHKTKSGLNVYARAAASGTARTIYVVAYGGN